MEKPFQVYSEKKLQVGILNSTLRSTEQSPVFTVQSPQITKGQEAKHYLDVERRKFQLFWVSKGSQQQKPQPLQGHRDTAQQKASRTGQESAAAAAAERRADRMTRRCRWL